MTNETTRVLSEFYDSVRQRRHFNDSAALLDALKARLRFDWLLHKTVVLTDAQLLDGLSFIKPLLNLSVTHCHATQTATHPWRCEPDIQT